MTHHHQASIKFSLTTAHSDSHDDRLYVSEDPDDNKVRLTLITDKEIKLRPAKLVGIQDADKACGSLFCLDLSNLEIDKELLCDFFFGRQIHKPRWNSRVYCEDNMIVFTPSAPMCLLPEEPLSFPLSNFVLPSAPSARVGLTLDIFNVEGVAEGSFPMRCSTEVALARPPKAQKDLHDAMCFDINPRTVHVGVPSQLRFTLSLNNDKETIYSSKDSVFMLSVVYGSDPGQDDNPNPLITKDCGSHITIQQLQPEYPMVWTITNRDEVPGRSWELQPPQQQPLFGLYSQPVTFEFSYVKAIEPPGPTTLKLAYSDIPGYKNGCFTFALEKSDNSEQYD